ncbi:acetoacetate-CoA ligase [Lobosporangium transversale]|uniref:Acetoacetate-CoA ligase n=1 Tax=Lobosporangium transversale TaxID=64571 RepID=A0A1Y2H0H0_9FUNG|nr:acetoacetate-CoA ligase [Lobosporangium transversale]ORZ28038.1 acetoacetate-CoA ligase [Lobosporangium transversale]|eukprot:XP_021885741.1 acetoacetate-CoA ligase [Lobosporangium transversale]
MEKFRIYINQKHSLALANYHDLWKWSVDEIEKFWTAVWDYTHVIASIPPSGPVVDGSAPMDTFPIWFKSARLNFAENALWCKDTTKTAIIATGELQETPRRISYAELYTRVRQCAKAMRKAGVVKGDRVAGYIANCPEAIIAMLAAASIGAIWSSTSPDFGTIGVLDRFSQIKPKLLFSVNAVVYNGRPHDHVQKLRQVLEGLEMVEKVILIPFVPSSPCDASSVENGLTWSDFLATSGESIEPFSAVSAEHQGQDQHQNQHLELIEFEPLPFNHPLYILFSSGTTGKPKCIVHSAGGMLLQHKKEHILHGNLNSSDILFQYTTTGWMMWNWLVSGLTLGATIVLYDGSPFKPGPSALWDLVEQEKITAFGTSAKYIQAIQDVNYFPNKFNNLSSLHSIYSTGSPLKPESFDFVYDHVKKDVLLGSITGGTDICSLFASHNAALPVYRGEIQCRSLGMKIEAWTAPKTPVLGSSGDLVCSRLFPCMPVYFWDDPDNKKYKAAYFDNYIGVWYHGDFVWINPNTGGIVMLGRSDGTLNPSGVRFGSAEIYNIVDTYPEVEDSLCVGQTSPDGTDERVILFLKVAGEAGKAMDAPLDLELVNRIKTHIRNQLSPRHVPAVVLKIADIPYTINGKKVEIAVKKIISGQTVVPSGTLVNPESLDLYYNIPELKQ